MTSEHEPESVTRARELLRRYDADGVCPVVDRAKNVCVWTCPECKATMPPTHASHVDGGQRYPTRCSLKGRS